MVELQNVVLTGSSSLIYLYKYNQTILLNIFLNSFTFIRQVDPKMSVLLIRHRRPSRARDTEAGAELGIYFFHY